MNQLSLNAFEVMAIELRHTLQTYNLAMKHRDPFDRTLVAQSRLERMPISTRDPLIMQYEVDVIW
jgi:PIN domain nuclease of toxin-antitoxin system